MKPRILFISLIFILNTNLQAQEFKSKFFCFEDAFFNRYADSLDFQYNLVSKLGFNGMEFEKLDQIEEKIRLLDKYKLKLFMVYVRVDLESEHPYDTLLYDFIKKVKNQDVTLWLHIHSKKFASSDPAGDEICVPILRELADYASNYGVRIAIYHHINIWVEKVEDGIRLTQKINRPNVGAVFNLCHFLRRDDRSKLDEKLTRAIPYLFAVSINGADDGETNAMNWDQLIQPLGKGTFDVLHVLRILKDNNYKGPVGLQCYSIPGDPAEFLKISAGAWKKYMNELSKSQ